MTWNSYSFFKMKFKFSYISFVSISSSYLCTASPKDKVLQILNFHEHWGQKCWLVSTCLNMIFRKKVHVTIPNLWKLCSKSNDISSHFSWTLELHHTCKHTKSGSHVVEIWAYISEANIYIERQHTTANENLRCKCFTWVRTSNMT